MFYHITADELKGNRCPVGTWPMRIDRVTDKKSPAGNMVMWIGWKVVGDEPPAGTDAVENITMIPDAIWKLNDLFEKTGFVPSAEGFNSQELIGLQARCVVVEETYEGQLRSKVTSHLPL